MSGDAREIAKAMTDGMVAMSLLKAEVERLKALVRSQAKALTAAERVAISLVRAHRIMKEVEGDLSAGDPEYPVGLSTYPHELDLETLPRLIAKLKEGRGEQG